MKQLDLVEIVECLSGRQNPASVPVFIGIRPKCCRISSLNFLCDLRSSCSIMTCRFLDGPKGTKSIGALSQESISVSRFNFIQQLLHQTIKFRKARRQRWYRFLSSGTCKTRDVFPRNLHSGNCVTTSQSLRSICCSQPQVLKCLEVVQSFFAIQLVRSFDHFECLQACVCGASERLSFHARPGSRNM